MKKNHITISNYEKILLTKLNQVWKNKLKFMFILDFV